MFKTSISAQSFYIEMLDRISSSKAVFYKYFDETYSYEDLYSKINKFSAILPSGKNKRIVVIADKSMDHYSLIIAILLSGNTWVPINPSTPDNRLKEMIEQANPVTIFTDGTLLPESKRIADKINATILKIDNPIPFSSQRIQLPKFDEDSIAMIYFTSGSTGIPKGVKVTHQNYIINVRNIMKLVAFEPPEIFADYHDLGFVISVPILFPCVMTNSTLSPGKRHSDIMIPIRHMIENRISVLITVPSTISRIRKANQKNIPFPDLNIFISCGEPMHLDILKYGLESMEANQILNFYGSTEVAPWIFYHSCSPGDLIKYKNFGFVPIGTPIAGNEILLTKQEELWVSSKQVVPGYLGGVGTQQFQQKNGKRWYKTGDKVIYHKGIYLCKGRLDSQIKISGYRIELMEVESHLRSIEGVEAAVCFTQGEGIDKLIVAVLITVSDYKIKDIRTWLASKLPNYMLPRKVYCSPEVPLNKSGKIDRLSIKRQYTASPE